jgi:CO/xanthine dehydrogenase Mo-binding subunit
MTELAVIGRSYPRVDAREKVTGRAVYTYDMAFPGMLYGKLLRSPYPHARIVSLDTARAKRAPGVLAVITNADVPQKKFGAFVQDEYALAKDRVRYVGDPVAAIAAVDEDAALEALELIEVEYEELPAVFDPEAAMQPGAPAVHDGVELNIVAHNKVVGGDIEQGFREADHVFEDRFSTSRQCHVALEPHGCIATWDPSGKITFYASTQSTFFMRFLLADIFSMSQNRIRIIAPYLGGGFGAKSEPHAIDVCAIVLSRMTGRPVKMFHSRDEEFYASRTRHPQITYIKTGITKDGKLTTRQVRAILDYVVYTNNPYGGAFRGFGSPQFTFAAESQLDMIAARLSMDPIELRLKNVSLPGDVTISGPRVTTCGTKECIEQAVAASGYNEKRGKRNGRGVGIAAGVHFVSGKFHPGINADFCGSTVRINEDGSVTLTAGSVEMGTGTSTALSMIAAEELGVELEDVELTLSDSDTIPADFGTYGSRVTTLGGNAVRLACQQAKQRLFAVAAEKLGIGADTLTVGDRRVFVKDNPATGVPLAEVVQSSVFRYEGQSIMGQAHYDAPCSLPDPETGVGDFAQSYTFGADVVEVEVDRETGQVTVLNYVGAKDIGTVIHPPGAEGQVEGGAAQGLGYALTEDLVCENGQPINPTMMDYKILSAMEMPPVQSIFVQTNDPRGPYGAKGLGEMGLVMTAPAVANAIYDAVGVRITDLPITPEKILKALKQQQ